MGTEFDPTNKHILITSPTTTLTALEIYNATMDWCDDQQNVVHTVPMQAVGKFDMGGGVYSDSIFQLINGWKLKFWSTTEHFKVTGTLLPETPATSRHVTPADVEYQVSAQATVTDIPEISDIKAKTDHIPSDLEAVPTASELETQHGSGSWEGATPTQLWGHEQRRLTSRAIEEGQFTPQYIAAEDTLDDIKGTAFQTDVDSLKKIRESLEELKALKPTPKSKAQQMEQG